MLRAIPLLAVCLALSGCFVLDELDAGREILDKNSPQDAKPAEPEATGESEKTPTRSAWWSSAKSMNRGPEGAEEADPGDPNAVVSCRIGGTTRFTRRGDCLSQGGTPTR